ncbi:energy transducer TonB [bacterium]|nr:energy transducer TonB [bacterium]
MPLALSLIFSLLIHLILFSLFGISFVDLQDLHSRLIKISFVNVDSNLDNIDDEKKIQDLDSVNLDSISLPPGALDKDIELNKDKLFVYPDQDNSEIELADTKKHFEEQKGGVTISTECKRKVLRLYYPSYPVWAKKMGIEAEIKLKFQISKDGIVKNILFENMSGYPEIDVLGVRAVKNWKFEPDLDIYSQNEWSTVTLKFNIN